MAEETRFRRGAESVAEYQKRKATAGRAATETHKKSREDLQEEAYGVYERTTGKKVDRGIAGGASRKAYQEWARSAAGKAAWKAHRAKPKKKKNPGVTTQDAGDALAESE